METYEKEIRDILASVKETSEMMKEDNVRLDNIAELVESNAEKAEKILAMMDETSKGLSRLEEKIDSMDRGFLKKMNQKAEIMEILNRINDRLECRTPASEIVESMCASEEGKNK